MATPPSENPLHPAAAAAAEEEKDNPAADVPDQNDIDGGDEEDEDYNVADDDEDDEEGEPTPPTPASERAKMNSFLGRLSSGPVRLRVHDVIIRGNSRTRDELIEAEVLVPLRAAATMQELLQAAAAANARLRRLDVFDSVSITLDAGPPELPGTANVVIEVVEAKNPLTGDLGIFTRPEARTWSLEGSLKLKNRFGYGEIWDVSGAYGWDQTSELSAGLSLPRFKALSTPLMARVLLLSQDWLKFSSYKERLLGISLTLLSLENHDLSYDLTWRNLTDPNRQASKSIRSLLGHSLLSSIKYTYKIDRRDSQLRPTRGYAFSSTFQLGGLIPDTRSVRFFRQEYDLRGAVPLGFFNSAFNLGVSAGLVIPWGSLLPLPDRFYIGGTSSPICTLRGPSSLLGFKTRGLGPSDLRRVIPTRTDNDESNGSPGRDALGGNLAVTAFADISFDLPLKILREAGIHGHAFACAGNVAALPENGIKNFSLKSFRQTFRTSVGFGLIVPTKLFRMEINYCHIARQLEHDKGKTGVQFSFSSPSQ